MKNVLLELNGKELQHIEIALNHLASKYINLLARGNDNEIRTELNEVSALANKILIIIEDNFEIVANGLNNN